MKKQKWEEKDCFVISLWMIPRNDIFASFSSQLTAKEVPA